MPQSADERLLAQRTIGLGYIDEKSRSGLEAYLLLLQLESATEPIRLLIDSRGGSINDGFFLHDFIARIMSAPIHALVTGNCSSSATLVLLACQRRQCLPQAQFVIHSGDISEIKIFLNERIDEQIDSLSRQAKKTRERVIKLYMEKLKLPRSEIEALIYRGDGGFDFSLSAREALKIGLVEKIVWKHAGIFPRPPAQS